MAGETCPDAVRHFLNLLLRTFSDRRWNTPFSVHDIRALLNIGVRLSGSVAALGVQERLFDQGPEDYKLSQLGQKAVRELTISKLVKPPVETPKVETPPRRRRRVIADESQCQPVVELGTPELATSTPQGQNQESVRGTTEHAPHAVVAGQAPSTEHASCAVHVPQIGTPSLILGFPTTVRGASAPPLSRRRKAAHVITSDTEIPEGRADGAAKERKVSPGTPLKKEDPRSYLDPLAKLQNVRGSRRSRGSKNLPCDRVLRTLSSGDSSHETLLASLVTSSNYTTTYSTNLHIPHTVCSVPTHDPHAVRDRARSPKSSTVSVGQTTQSTVQSTASNSVARVLSMAQTYALAYKTYTNSYSSGYSYTRMRPGSKTFRYFQAAIVNSDTLGVSFDVYVRAQFYWFDRWFNRPPTPWELRSSSSKLNALERVRKYLELLEQKVASPETVAQVNRAVVGPVIPAPSVSLKVRFQQSEVTLRTMMRNYQLSEEEILRVFAKGSQASSYFDASWLKANETYRRLRDAGEL